jgi:integrase
VGELSGAKVADVDTDARMWHLPMTKNGEPHDVHLSDFAVRHIERLLALRGESEFLLPSADPDFPIGGKIIAKAIRDRMRATPLKGRAKASQALLLAGGEWTPHDLRRTMATRMRESLKVSSDVIERCLNHKPEGIVGVYQKGELLEERKAAFEEWGALLDRLMAASNVVELTRKAVA